VVRGLQNVVAGRVAAGHGPPVWCRCAFLPIRARQSL